jgi:hypothetical protein
MRSYGFRVVSSDSDNVSGVPIAVAGQAMVDIQRLLTDIGCMMVRLQLRIQNSVPEDLRRKYDLRIGGGDDSGFNSGPSSGNEKALEKTLEILCATLDFLGKGAVGTWMEDTFQDDDSRIAIARDLLDLNDHLQGYILEYGTADDVKRFEGLDRKRLEEHAVEKDNICGIVGVVVRDAVKKNHWSLTNDEFAIPLSFSRNIAATDIPLFASAGPVILVGSVKRNKEGHITRMEQVTGCYTVPHINFMTVVTPKTDRELFNPLIAATSYDAGTDTWRLRNDILGIDVSKPSWDECTVAFHDYAEFLFETYADPDQKFQGEEQEIREFLLSLLPV